MKRAILFLWAAAAIAAPPQRIPSEARSAAAEFKVRFPGAVLESVRAPGPEDPGGSLGGERLYWIFRYRAGARFAEASLAPDGLVVRITAPIAPREIPPAVLKTLQETWPGLGLDGISRQEIRASLRFIPAGTPDLIYGLTFVKDGRTVNLDIRPDGSLRPRPASISNALTELSDDPFYPPPLIKEKDIPIPAEAVFAVEAVKREFPGAIVQSIQPNVFNDRTGTVETVYFDVEIGFQGRTKTVPVTPDGILLYKVTPRAEGDLPPAVARAASQACPGGTFRKAVLQEVRAVPRFVPIDPPRIVYTTEVLDRGRRDIAIIGPDGTRIVPTRSWRWRGR